MRESDNFFEADPSYREELIDGLECLVDKVLPIRLLSINTTSAVTRRVPYTLDGDYLVRHFVQGEENLSLEVSVQSETLRNDSGESYTRRDIITLADLTKRKVGTQFPVEEKVVIEGEKASYIQKYIWEEVSDGETTELSHSVEEVAGIKDLNRFIAVVDLVYEDIPEENVRPFNNVITDDKSEYGNHTLSRYTITSKEMQN